MNLYEKVTAFLKLNKVREKDIVMAYGYTPEKILIITPYLLKNSKSMDPCNIGRCYNMEI